MTEHTKEPWAHRNGRIYQADRDVLTIANIARASDGDYSEANARRIVACVNACAGLQTEYLEKVGLPEFTGKTLCADMVQQELDRVTDQRDQLLTVLDGMVAMWKTTCDAMEWEPDHLAEYDIARQAISAVKGE